MIYFYFSFLHLEDKYKKTVFFKEKTQFWFGLFANLPSCTNTIRL